jgi:hypothetical protein
MQVNQVISHTMSRLMLLMVLCFPLVTMAGTDFMSVPLDGLWQPKVIKSVSNPKKVRQRVYPARLRLLPLAPAQTMVVTIRLPKGVTISKGSLTQQLTGIKKGQIIELDYAFDLQSEQALNIIADITLIGSDQFKQGKAFVLALNPQAKTKVNTRIINNEQGDKLIVY